MPTPKRASSPPATPRSSKRLRAAAAVAVPTPDKSTSSPSAKRTKRTAAAATVAVPNGKTVVAVVERAEPDPSPKKGRGTQDSRVPEIKAETTVLEKDGSVAAKGTARQANGVRSGATVVDTKAKSTPAKSTPNNTAAAAADGAETKAKPTAAAKKAAKDAAALAMNPLAARAAGLRMNIGAHVSAAGGPANAVSNATHVGANALALFLKSQRKWDNPPLSADAAKAFRDACKTQSYDAAAHVVPHGSYLVNLAQADAAKAAQAYAGFVDDLKRCEALGIKLYNLHPGNTGGAPRAEALGRIAAAINRAHAETDGIVPLLENMAGAGNVVGGSFEDLATIIDGVKDKERVGVCLDTCHAFAAGYDLRSPETYAAVMRDFDKVVGLKFLKALHLNDSKAPLGSRRDLHANIGTGFLGLRAFHNVVNDARLEGLPMVLETPIERSDAKTGKSVDDKSVWAGEIKLLEGLIGADPDTQDFKDTEARLARQGEAERERIGAQAEKRKVKDGKAKTGAGKRKRKQADSDEDSE